MGYTHYWTPRNYTQEEWEQALPDIKKVLKTESEWICFEEGDEDQEAIADTDQIRFNGRGEQAHETFVIGRKSGKWSFCKTQKKPYDTAVTACLLVLAKHLGLEVSSDGFWYEWQQGRNLVQDLLGYTDEDLAAAKEAIWDERWDAKHEAEQD